MPRLAEPTEGEKHFVEGEKDLKQLEMAEKRNT